MIPKRIRLYLLLILFVLSLHNLFPSPLPNAPKNNNGVVVVFYHNLAGQVSVFRVAKHRDWVTAERRMARVWQGSGEKLFVELHGTIPGLAVLHERIQQWRRQSEASGVPLFTFTLVREPVSYSRSYFQHFHPPNCQWKWCERNTFDQDNKDTFDENLLQTVVPNHQCKLLLLGQRENKKRKNVSDDVVVTKEQCQDELVPLLEQDWDWVGITETLQTVTLPLLTRILFNNEDLARQMTKRNASRPRVVNNGTQLKTSTTDRIRQQSSFDQELYERVQRGPWQRTK